MNLRKRLGGLSIRELTRRVWQSIQDDNIFGYAAQLSYYFFFALFPLLIILITIFGFFADDGTSLRSDMLRYLARAMPPSAYGLIAQTLEEITKAASGGKVWLGVGAALWAASNGMGAIVSGLNVAYGIKESRPWWKVQLITLALTLSLSLMVISGLALVFYGGKIGGVIAANHGFGTLFTSLWQIAQWPLGLFLIVLFFSAVYYFAPAPHGQRWHFISPGALIGLTLWLLVSLGFRLYLHYFNSYSKTYGSLGAVIILLLWFYLMGAAILIGGEINSEIAAQKHEIEGQVPEGDQPVD
jgi:membrane protein